MDVPDVPLHSTIINGRPSDECLDNDCSGQGHSTLFQKPVGCEKCLDDTCRKDDTIGSPVWMATRRRFR
jgi:hypothetical protein